MNIATLAVVPRWFAYLSWLIGAVCMGLPILIVTGRNGPPREVRWRLFLVGIESLGAYLIWHATAALEVSTWGI